MAAELLLAIAINGQSAGACLAGRDRVSGSAFLVVLVIFAMMPFLTGRARPLGENKGPLH